MALVSAVINRSLRLLNVIDPQEQTPALDSQTAITALNAMCRRWEANGMAISWSPVSAVDDTMPTPDEAEECIVYNLAVRLAPEYVPPASFALIEQRARESLAELRRDRAVEMPLVMANDLPRNGQFFDIYTDSIV